MVLLMKKHKLNILYEDKYLLAVIKPSKLLTVGTDKEKNKTLYHYVMEYLNSKNQKVFIVHRLDKDTSGIVLFAKNEKVKRILQDNWEQVKREYIAVVNGNPKERSGTIKSYLKENKSLLVYSTNDKKNGKLAITDYDVIKSNGVYSLVRINIKTGRKNQIRVHFNDMGNPIVGDNKYGMVKNKNAKRLFLHASYLEFIHPIIKKVILLEDAMPQEFTEMVN